MGRSQLHSPSWALSAALMLAIGGCADARGVTGDVVESRSDSAGVEMVLLSGNAESVPVFAIAGATAELRLGAPTAQPTEQFGAVRDVVPLSDGGIAVLDEQGAEVRLFGPDGQYRGTLGSKGDGPGEFRSPIALVSLPGDTIAVFDPVPRRITRFGPDGSLAGAFTLGDSEDFFSDARFLPDGRLVGQSHWHAPDGGGPPSLDSRLIRNTVVLTVFDSSGQVLDTLDVVASAEEVVSIRRSAGGLSVFKRPPVFARDNVFATQPNGVWSSDNDRFELRFRDLKGRLVRIVRAPFLSRPATADMAEAIRDQAMTEVESAGERAQLDMWYELSPQPETVPAFDQFHVDRHGRLWVRAWSASGAGSRWWVMRDDGTLLGSVELASGMTITSIGCRSVLGVEQDELGVDYVVRYPLSAISPC